MLYSNASPRSQLLPPPSNDCVCAKLSNGALRYPWGTLCEYSPHDGGVAHLI
ncbi:hypothetical protein [Coleofasciculus sp.]|uniref:hypothetical protein n=1 Tax=Coleofasciculus sp. TaxID=3100458 RepID=UPI003A2A6D97